MKETTWMIIGAVLGGAGWVGAAETAVPAPAAPAAAVAQAPAAVRVEKIAVGTAIDNKEISGEASQFAASVNRVYCWVKVAADQVPAALKVVWSADGKKEAEVPLDIKYTSMRTWSSKNVWPGSWKVEAVDNSGTVLSSKEFTIAQESAPAAPAATPTPAAPPAGQ
jgi:hypothetical protein